MTKFLFPIALLVSTSVFAGTLGVTVPSDGTAVKVYCQDATRVMSNNIQPTYLTTSCVAASPTPSPSPSPSVSPSPKPSPSPSPTVTVTPSPSPSVTPTPIPSPSVSPVPPAGKIAMINETVSFEVQMPVSLKSRVMKLVGLSSALPSVAGLKIDVFQVQQVNVSPLTSLKGGTPGLYDEPLFPVTGLTGGLKYWIDVTVLQPGNYSFQVGGQSFSVRGLNHTMPAQASLPAYVELEPNNLLAAHYTTSANVSVECPLIQTYATFLRAHRIEPINHLAGGLKVNAAGTGIDLDSFYPQYGCSPRQLLLNGSIAPPMLWKNGTQSAAFLKAAQADLVAGNLPAGSWNYACDESGCGSATLTQLALNKANAPLIKNMATRTPSWSALIDEPFPNFDSGVTGAYGAYGSCTSAGTCGNGSQGIATGTPILGALDAPQVNARAYAWVAFVNGSKAELYYDSTYAIVGAWNQGGLYQFGQWGDGTLMFPGKIGFQGLTVDTPIAGIRLKEWRRGLEDVEYAVAAKAAGLSIPYPVQGFKSWSKNEADYDAYKVAVATALGW